MSLNGFPSGVPRGSCCPLCSFENAEEGLAFYKREYLNLVHKLEETQQELREPDLCRQFRLSADIFRPQRTFKSSSTNLRSTPRRMLCNVNKTPQSFKRNVIGSNLATRCSRRRSRSSSRSWKG